MLTRDVLVAELLRDLEGAVEDARQLARDDGVGGGAGDAGPLVEVRLDLPGERLRARPQLLENGHDDAVRLLQKSEQEVLGQKLRVAPRSRVALGFLDGLLGLDGELVKTHADPRATLVPEVWTTLHGRASGGELYNLSVLLSS